MAVIVTVKALRTLFSREKHVEVVLMIRVALHLQCDLSVSFSHGLNRWHFYTEGSVNSLG